MTKDGDLDVPTFQMIFVKWGSIFPGANKLTPVSPSGHIPRVCQPAVEGVGGLSELLPQDIVLLLALLLTGQLIVAVLQQKYYSHMHGLVH